jgi:hypothetical protein
MWYELAVRDLCDLSKPIQEKLAEAAEAKGVPVEEEEEGGDQVPAAA